MDNTRFWLAVVLAPLPVPVIFGFVFAQASWPWFFLFFVMGALTSYMGLLVLGLPLFHLLRRMGWLSLPALTFAGGLAGVAVFYFFMMLLTWSGTSTPFGWLQLMWGVAFGVSVGLLFCLIAGVPFRSTKGPLG